jgi:hypothetical protein
MNKMFIHLNKEESELYLRVIALRKEKKKIEGKIIILQDEICRNEFNGHEFNEKDRCVKCGLREEDKIEFSTSLDYNECPNFIKSLYDELGLEYEEDE